MLGDLLAVQRLGLHAFTTRAEVRSLVGELRSHKPFSWAKKGERSAGPPRFFFSGPVFLEWGQRIYMWHMFPINADALGPGHTLGTPPTLWHPP